MENFVKLIIIIADWFRYVSVVSFAWNKRYYWVNCVYRNHDSITISHWKKNVEQCKSNGGKFVFMFMVRFLLTIDGYVCGRDFAT